MKTAPWATLCILLFAIACNLGVISWILGDIKWELVDLVKAVQAR